MSYPQDTLAAEAQTLRQDAAASARRLEAAQDSASAARDALMAVKVSYQSLIVLQKKFLVVICP